MKKIQLCRTLESEFEPHQYLYVYEYMDKKRFSCNPGQRSAGVTPQVNLRNPLHAGAEVCKQGIDPGFETQGKCQERSKNRVTSGPTRRTYVLQIILLKNKTNIVYPFAVLLNLMITQHKQYP